MSAGKRPVTIVTGFLGSGKTTLLAQVLTHPSMANTAVLVNELGEVGLDHHLLRRLDEQTVLVGGGCLCCAARGDLSAALLDLLGREERGEIPPLERIVVETTGLADPGPILFTIVTHPVLQHHFVVDRVICTVDAVNGALHIEGHAESVRQLAAADHVVVTKTDIAAPGAVDGLTARVRALNPSARLTRAVHGLVPLGELFGPVHLGTGARLARSGEPAPADGPHSGDVRSLSLAFDEPIDWNVFGVWLSMLLHARGEQMLRVKGLVDTGEQGAVLLNGVQHVIHPPEHLGFWPDDEPRSRLVFILQGIEPDELTGSLDAFLHGLGHRAPAAPLALRP
jgi:G3E family GTPase